MRGSEDAHLFHDANGINDCACFHGLELSQLAELMHPEGRRRDAWCGRTFSQKAQQGAEVPCNTTSNSWATWWCGAAAERSEVQPDTAGRQAGRRKHVPQQGMCRTLNMMYGMADESASSSAGSTELLRSR